jgi:hypothetical protein
MVHEPIEGVGDTMCPREAMWIGILKHVFLGVYL